MSLTRRDFIGGLAAIGTAGLAGEAHAYSKTFSGSAMKYFAGTQEDNGHTYRRTNWKKIKDKWRRQLVAYQSTEPLGSVVVDASNHFLYVVFENQTALRYGVGVGRDGFRWYGRARIDRKALWPRWVPPPEMRKRQPDLPEYVDGGIDNPLGPRALYLHRNGKDLGYRLHGTMEPWSIGSNVSSGCVRMFPEDVIDLYQRCPIGTRVLVLRHLGAPVIDESAEVDSLPSD
ncbi:L,D-transpeptidase [Taklimakanibacter lacteus]|uniref:L,D-transpeptidase n=1 Tax=Taklimakanibacter lacteus TaxID=2268456 RepID=UPI000E66313A